jgi:hypothetical protein
MHAFGCDLEEKDVTLNGVILTAVENISQVSNSSLFGSESKKVILKQVASNLFVFSHF